MNVNGVEPRARIIKAATGGTLVDRQYASLKANLLMPPVPLGHPETFVLDLGGDEFEIGSLQNLILPLAERIRNGFYGTAKLVVATRDPGATLFINYLAAKHSLPMFLSTGTTTDALRDATPAGSVSATELVTLDAVLSSGGPGITASSLAQQFGIELTAAGNRLTNLEKRGYVYRFRQPGREGDRFIDPRSAIMDPTIR